MFEHNANHQADSRSSSQGANWFERYGIRHLAIIPDGNRRWAQQRKLPAEIGHSNGLRVLNTLVDKLCIAGVHTLTVWGFSTENWARESTEVKHIMKIGAQFLRDHVLDIANKHDARVHHLGRRDRLFPEVREALEEAEKATADHKSHVYNIALDYGGRDELVRASERLAAAVKSGSASEGASIVDYLDTVGQPFPEPDIVIRTSGEQRLSGFLPLQTVYSELFFVDQMFPELTMDSLEDIAEQFRFRKRRFGS